MKALIIEPRPRPPFFPPFFFFLPPTARCWPYQHPEAIFSLLRSRAKIAQPGLGTPSSLFFFPFLSPYAARVSRSEPLQRPA